MRVSGRLFQGGSLKVWITPKAVMVNIVADDAQSRVVAADIVISHMPMNL